MKLGFNDLIEAYNEFKFIQSTYKGEKTDWYEVHLKLYNLMKSLKEDVRQSGNYSFNLFVKRNLLSAIEEEYTRVGKIIDEKERKEMEKSNKNTRYCPKCGKPLFFRQIMFEGSIHYHSECKGCHYRPKSLPGKTIQESLELLDNWLNK